MKSISILVLGLMAGSHAIAQMTDVPVADFSGPTYGDWTVSGSAFGSGPVNGVASSAQGGDAATGKLTSPEFKIERKFITLQIGGGGWTDQTCVNLIVNGRVMRTATGPNLKPGGTDQLIPVAWDVTKLLGRPATLEIIDDRTEAPWGHIEVGRIVQTDDRGPVPLAAPVGTPDKDVTRDVLIQKKLLNFPIRAAFDPDARRPLVTITVDGVLQRRFLADLANGTPVWWAPLDVSAWKGKKIRIKVNELPLGSHALDSLRQSDSLLDAADLYHEDLRPQFHFTSKRGWVNDSNGLVFYQGKYHLFCQHNPFGLEMGSAHWAHATSTDLVHWHELPVALYPSETEWHQASGSAVVDWHNTSGFGQDGKPPLVVIYATAGPKSTESVAYSTDGVTFAKYAGNPVIPEITPSTRDPKVFWYEPGRHWVLVLYSGMRDPSGALDEHGHPKLINSTYFFTSPDLKKWTQSSVFNSNLFECPDFYELAVDGDPSNKKWVLSDASGAYYLGTFDGAKFTPETPKLPGRLIGSYYAAQTFNDMPDGRRVRMAWVLALVEGMPFNSAQTLPVEVKLHQTPDGPRLTAMPVKELESLRDGPNRAPELDKFRSDLIELRAEFEPGPAQNVEFDLRGMPIIYDAQKQRLMVNGASVPAPLQNGKQQLIVYVDRAVTEVFASGGLVYVPMPFIAKEEDRSVSIKADGAKITGLEVYKLKSAWDQ